MKKVVKKAMKKVVEKAMKKVEEKAMKKTGIKKHAVKATSKSLKDAVAKLTDAQRLKLRPEGCGKCRRKHGCSPSCFTSWATLEK